MKLTGILREAANIRPLRYVPNSRPALENDVLHLNDFVAGSKRLFVLSGAGVSTESGIPDYRSEGVGLYARTSRRPMQYQEFVKSELGRQRYWARNYVGWPQFASFQPNICHKVISQWESLGKVHWLVTQNVDALHTKAGSQKVTELHGCSHRVVCLSCNLQMPRWDLQKIFKEINPDWHVESNAIAPDGDVMLSEDQVKDFKVPSCPNCKGVLKPDVIFFGDNVARPKVDFVYGKVDESDSILVLGSSLFVYSGYKFVNRAADQGKPIAILNIGETRADKLVSLKIEAKCGDVIPKVKL